MWVQHLSLTNFRSYASAELDLDHGVNIFVGPNGQGKTNLVEAVEFLSTLSSHRVASDAPLIKADTPQAIVRAKVLAGVSDDRSLLLEVEINPNRPNRARINQNQQPKARDLIGALRTVVFSPEDLAIVKGDPADRRYFIDTLAIARWPRLAGVKADYERVLKQRNSLLKSMSGWRGEPSPDAMTTLEVWDASLAKYGAEITAGRLETLGDMMPLVSSAYAKIAPTNNDATAYYKAKTELPQAGPDERREAIKQALLDAIQIRRRDEIRRGVSLVGPHRDEIVFHIGPLPAKGYASHGESWSLALALRLGAFHLLRADGIEPVLILDDVFAELDATRRARLAEEVSSAEQTLITAAVPHDVPTQLDGAWLRVHPGEVERVADRSAADV